MSRRIYPLYLLYTILLLFLPKLYLSRIERLDGNADLAREGLFKMATKETWSDKVPSSTPREGRAFLNHILELENNTYSKRDVYQLPPSYRTLGKRWTDFIDNLLQEWQTLNVVSVLLIPSVSLLGPLICC